MPRRHDLPYPEEMRSEVCAASLADDLDDDTFDESHGTCTGELESGEDWCECWCHDDDIDHEEYEEMDE